MKHCLGNCVQDGSTVLPGRILYPFLALDIENNSFWEEPRLQSKGAPGIMQHLVVILEWVLSFLLLSFLITHSFLIGNYLSQ